MERQGYRADADMSKWHGNQAVLRSGLAGLYFLDESGVIWYKKIAG